MTNPMPPPPPRRRPSANTSAGNGGGGSSGRSASSGGIGSHEGRGYAGSSAVDGRSSPTAPAATPLPGTAPASGRPSSSSTSAAAGYSEYPRMKFLAHMTMAPVCGICAEPLAVHERVIALMGRDDLTTYLGRTRPFAFPRYAQLYQNPLREPFAKWQRSVQEQEERESVAAKTEQNKARDKGKGKAPATARQSSSSSSSSSSSAVSPFSRVPASSLPPPAALLFSQQMASPFSSPPTSPFSFGAPSPSSASWSTPPRPATKYATIVPMPHHQSPPSTPVIETTDPRTAAKPVASVRTPRPIHMSPPGQARTPPVNSAWLPASRCAHAYTGTHPPGCDCSSPWAGNGVQQQPQMLHDNGPPRRSSRKIEQQHHGAHGGIPLFTGTRFHTINAQEYGSGDNMPQTLDFTKVQPTFQQHEQLHGRYADGRAIKRRQTNAAAPNPGEAMHMSGYPRPVAPQPPRGLTPESTPTPALTRPAPTPALAVQSPFARTVQHRDCPQVLVSEPPPRAAPVPVVQEVDRHPPSVMLQHRPDIHRSQPPRIFPGLPPMKPLPPAQLRQMEHKEQGHKQSLEQPWHQQQQQQRQQQQRQQPAPFAYSPPSPALPPPPQPTPPPQELQQTRGPPWPLPPPKYLQAGPPTPTTPTNASPIGTTTARVIPAKRPRSVISVEALLSPTTENTPLSPPLAPPTPISATTMSFPANAAHPPHSGVKQEPTISSQPQPAPRHQQQQRQQQHQPAPPASGSKRNVRCAAHLQRTLATGDFKSHFVSGRQAPASSASSAAAAAAEYAGCKQCETGPYFIAVHVACHAVFVRAYGEEKQQGVQQNNTQQTSSIGGLSLSLSSYSGTTGDHHKRSPVAGFVADATASSGSVSGYDETKGGVEYEYEAMRALWTEAIWREPWARAGPVTGIFRGGGKGSRPPPPWTPGVAARDSADRARLVSWALRPGGPVVPDSVRGGRGGLVLPPELMGNIAQLLTGGSNDHDDGVSLWTLLPAVSLAGRIVCVQREEATAAERTRQFQRQQQQQQQEESQCRSLQSLQSCRASPNTSTGAMAPVLLQNIVYWHRGDSGRGELVLLSDDAESRQKWLRARRREMLLNRPRRMSPAAYAAAAAAASHPQASAVAASILVDEFRQPMPNGSVPDDSVMTLVFDAYGLREIARGTEELRSRGPTSFAYMTYPVAVFCHTTVQFRHGRARLDFTATSKCSDIVCLDETRWLAGALALWQDPYWTWGKGLDPERGGPAMYRPRPGLLGCPEIKWRWRAGAWEWAYPHESLLPVEATVTRLADKLALWNTPNPPDLKACRFFPSDLAGLPQRFHCIPLENSSVRGITFFFAGGVLVAIHPHWAETAGGGYGEDVNTSMDGGDALQRYRRLMGGTGVTDTASSTYRRIAKRVDPNIAWVYLPIGPLDPIVLLGTRAALLDTRREQNCFSWTYSVVVWTERTGAIELGAQLGTAKATDCSTLLGSGDPVRLVYREPPEGKPIHCIGAVCLDPHGGPMERNEDDEPQPRVDSAFPQRNADHESSAEQLIGPGAYCSSAPLDHVTRAELYMEAGTGLARGMVMNYKDGSVRAVGECRVGIDPSIVVHDPWALCVRREWTTTAAAAGAAGVDVAVTSGKPPDSPTPRPATMTEGRRRRTTRVILLGRGEYHPVGHRADSRWVCWHMIGLICWYYRMDSSLVVIRES